MLKAVSGSFIVRFLFFRIILLITRLSVEGGRLLFQQRLKYKVPLSVITYTFTPRRQAAAPDFAPASRRCRFRAPLQQ